MKTALFLLLFISLLQVVQAFFFTEFFTFLSQLLCKVSFFQAICPNTTVALCQLDSLGVFETVYVLKRNVQSHLDKGYLKGSCEEHCFEVC